MRIAGARVEGEAPLGADAQGVASVAVTQMVSKTKALKAREEAGRAVAQSAVARVTLDLVALLRLLVLVRLGP